VTFVTFVVRKKYKVDRDLCFNDECKMMNTLHYLTWVRSTSRKIHYFSFIIFTFRWNEIFFKTI